MDNLNIRLCDGKSTIFNYTLGEMLGRGTTAWVYAVNEALPNNQLLVCKIIMLDNPTLSRALIFNCGINEIKILSQLGLLAGYQYDKMNDRLIILMRRAPGVTEKNSGSDKAAYASFKALRALHRIGIVHFDGHRSNFMYNEITGKSTAIDFGITKKYGLFAELGDYLKLVLYPRELPLSKLANFYVAEVGEYIKKNPSEVALKISFMISLLIPAISNTSIFGQTGVTLSQELIRHYFFTELLKLLHVVHPEGANGLPFKIMSFALETIGTLTFVRVVFENHLQSSYIHASNIVMILSTLYKTLSPADTAFWTTAGKIIPIENIGVALMGLMPLNAIYNITISIIERNILPEAAVMAITDFNHYGIHNTKNLLWNFGSTFLNKTKNVADQVSNYIRPKLAID